jgi:hypothetical protein
MLELNDIKNVKTGIDMSNTKTVSLPHSVVNIKSLSYRQAESESAAKALLPKYVVYVEDDGASIENVLKESKDSYTAGGKAVMTGVTEPDTYFDTESGTFDWDNANDIIEFDTGGTTIKNNGNLQIVNLSEAQGDDKTPIEGNSVEDSGVYKVTFAIPTLSTSDPKEMNLVIKKIQKQDTSDPSSQPVEIFHASLTDKIIINPVDGGGWELLNNGSVVANVELDASHTISIDTNNLVMTSVENEKGILTLAATEQVMKEQNIATMTFGQDGKNKTHTVTPASLTKTNKYINGMQMAIKYNVDEVVFVNLGTLKPHDGTIEVNDILLNDYIDRADEESENTKLLKKIRELGEEGINNVKCLTVNKTEKDYHIINWETSESELKELHPQDEDGNNLENLISGSIIISTSSEDPYDADKGLEGQDEGVIILSDHPVKEVVDDDGFVHLVLDETAVTSNGVLNRFRSVSFDLNGETVKCFEKEAYSVGKVFYNTGVVELNSAVPVVAGTSPALRCKASGMDNLKFNIKNKGTDGNKYSLKILKDHTENNGDVIYNVALMLNGTELDSIVCSSNPDGSTIEGTDAQGNIVDVDVPFIGTLDHDTFDASFTSVDFDSLKSLHEMVYNFDGGTDGVDGITAKDYIGYKDESGTAGAWLFDDVKYPAQMWPSLGYTDKEFYMAAQDIAWNRKDTTCVWDVPKGYSKKTAIAYREEEPVPSQWWTELYYNWCNDVYNGAIVELPPSYYVTKNSLASYKLNGTWFPVAGKERGTIDAASVINQVPAKLDRDEFITHNINPIYDTGNQGIQIYGNETLNAQYTDLSAAHIARTLTYIRSRVDAYTETLKFELNDVILWRTWIDYVKNNILDRIKSGRGLAWYRVSMGNDTTTAAELANRIVRGIVELQFVPDAEIFRIDYVCYSSAADNSTF